MGSGKTYLADKIVETFNYQKASFAGRVKELASELFNMENKDRELLINFATKMREIDSNVWINSMLRFANHFTDVVVDDLRLNNEYETLRSQNWIIVKLEIDEDAREKRLMEKYSNNYESHRKYFDSITENDVVNMSDDKFNMVIRNDKDIMLFINMIANLNNKIIKTVNI
jgi:hypothetical protein